jgi:hypothetical protein
VTRAALAVRDVVVSSTLPRRAVARYSRPLRRAFTLSLFAAAVLLTGYVIFLALQPQPDRLYDFRTFWNVGRGILEGNPGSFIYPPPVGLALLPLALLPFGLGAAIYVAILLLSIGLTLFVLGVRDPRCYAIALVSSPMLSSLGNGAITTLLALGLAVSWRYRDRRWVATVAVALTIVAKLFLWPLWFWLIATRRYATAGLVAVGGAVVALAGWAAIGFSGLRDYPDLLGRLAALVQDEGYSPIALTLALGFSSGVARAAAIALGVALLFVMYLVARREDGDRRAFIVAIVAALAFSPIVWLHYFALLIVPIAIVARRLSFVWLLPIAYIGSGVNSEGDVATILTVWVITAAIVASTLRRRPTTAESARPVKSRPADAVAT